MAEAPSVAILLAAWDQTRTRDVLARLGGAFADVSHRTVVVLNHPEALANVKVNRTTHVVPGSNADAEFSAYDEALRVVRTWSQPPEVLVVANDRALSYPSPNLRLCQPCTLRNVRAWGLAAGRVDLLPSPARVLGKNVRAYLRSNFLALPYADLPDEFRFTTVNSAYLDVLAPPDFSGRWIASGDLEPSYTEFLRNWLTEPDAKSWYGAAPLSSESWPTLRLKVKSILNEHLLSARLQEAGLTLASHDQARRPIRNSRQIARLALRAPTFEFDRLERARWALGSAMTQWFSREAP